MRLAVINEISACNRNQAILEALDTLDVELFNVGMKHPDDKPQLTYIHTGLMAAIALNSGAVHKVVGGCGTGQGFMLSAMQYPGVFCGLLAEPLDGMLFARINDGNCISLALNKGFGWAGEENMKMILTATMDKKSGAGFPEHRADSQRESRNTLKNISEKTHVSMATVIAELPGEIMKPIVESKSFTHMIDGYASDDEIKAAILNWRE
jgi:ribose 5-phosphate isomerase RpiB